VDSLVSRHLDIAGEWRIPNPVFSDNHVPPHGSRMPGHERPNPTVANHHDRDQ
jgi:hypothetical protein